MPFLTQLKIVLTDKYTLIIFAYFLIFTMGSSLKNLSLVYFCNYVLYIAAPQTGLHRPLKELKGFARVELAPDETRQVTFRLEDRSFAVWTDGWKIPGGTYQVLLGASSAEIRLAAELEIDGVDVPAPDWQAGSWYETCKGLPGDVDFEKAYGGPLQSDPPLQRGRYTMEHTTMELKDRSLLMKMMYQGMRATIAKGCGGKADDQDPNFRMMLMSAADAPLRAAVLSSGGTMPGSLMEGLLALANGHPVQGICTMLRK